MKKTLFAFIILCIILIIYSTSLKSCSSNIYLGDVQTISFHEISVNYPENWWAVSDTDTKLTIKSKDNNEGVVLIYTPYDYEISEAHMLNVLEEANKSLSSLNYYFESNKEITEFEYGKLMELKFSYSDEEFKTYSSRAKIFAYGNAVYTMQYFEEGTLLNNDKLLDDMFESIVFKEHIPVTTTTTTTEITTSNTQLNIAASDVNSNKTVYIGKTGTKYHKQSCSTLKGNGIPISLSDAISQGRTPCSRCKP